MIPKILHRIVFPPLKDEGNVAEYWRGFETLHPEWELKTWGPSNDFDGWKVQSAIGRCRTPAQVADLVRLEVLWRFGGVYVDADCEAVRPLDPLLVSSCFVGTEDGYLVSNAVIGAQPEHAAIGAYLDAILDENRVDLDRPPVEATGPVLATQILGGRDDVVVFPPEFFYPIPYAHRDEFTADDARTRFTYVTHHWAHSWRTVNQDLTSGLTTRQRIKLSARHAVGTVGRMATRRVQSWADGGGDPRHSQSATYVGDNRIVVGLPDGSRLLALSRDISLTPYLIADGVYDRPFWDFLSSVVRPGDHVADVGANIGQFTVRMGNLVGPFGRVHAFEPDPDAFELLEQNALVNWMHRQVTAYPCAAGSRNGTITLKQEHRLRGLSVATDLAPGSAQGSTESVEVAVRRLDFLETSGVPLRLVKIDVEGAESEVLDGAVGLLKRGLIRTIDIEIIRRDQSTWMRTREWIRRLCDEFGASLLLLGPDGLPRPSGVDFVLATAGEFPHVIFELPDR